MISFSDSISISFFLFKLFYFDWIYSSIEINRFLFKNFCSSGFSILFELFSYWFIKRIFYFS